MNEVWKDINGFEGLYQVSNFGRVKSNKTGKIKKPSFNNCGYLRVSLWNNGVGKHLFVHRLVAEHFLPNDDLFKIEINHKDECKTNNFVFVGENGVVDESKSNLEWCSSQYNTAYSQAKNVLQFDKQGNFIKEWESAIEVQRQLGFSHAHIGKCCQKKTHYNTSYGFVWRFKDDIEGWRRDYSIKDIE